MIRRFKAIPCILAASAPVLLSIGCRGTGHPARAAQAAPATEASYLLISSMGTGKAIAASTREAPVDFEIISLSLSMPMG